MGFYDPNHQNIIWGNTFNADSSPNTGASAVVETDAKLDNRVRHQCYLYMLITIILSGLEISFYLIGTSLMLFLQYILQLEDIPSEALGPSKRYNHGASKPANKVKKMQLSETFVSIIFQQKIVCLKCFHFFLISILES